mmetsp:Transcript_14305/g.47803  ORF Transcript_14305/g.47803 Transcript_14305/m.47803 type:complete len:216 (-) Transcript_14305:238-885(-)
MAPTSSAQNVASCPSGGPPLMANESGPESWTVRTEPSANASDPADSRTETVAFAACRASRSSTRCGCSVAARTASSKVSTSLFASRSRSQWRSVGGVASAKTCDARSAASAVQSSTNALGPTSWTTSRARLLVATRNVFEVPRVSDVCSRNEATSESVSVRSSAWCLDPRTTSTAVCAESRSRSSPLTEASLAWRARLCASTFKASTGPEKCKRS